MQYSSKSDIGKVRTINQDSLAVYLKNNGMILALVADGIGGGPAGEIASDIAAKEMCRLFAQAEFTEETDLYAWLRNAMEESNRAILADVRTNLHHYGMGTTLVGALITNRKTYVFNIGDSRLYFLKEGKLECATHDHTVLADMLESGMITPSEAEKTVFRNYLSSALGNREMGRMDVEAFDSDYQAILICSDGLYAYVEEEEILKTLLQDSDIDEKTDALIALANNAGGFDNVSVILLEKEDKA